jgi:hypothetical protein
MSRLKPRGFVLVTAMIFLAVLTLVAVIAIRSTGLELRMSSNLAEQTEAFESAETSRRLIAPMFELFRREFEGETVTFNTASLPNGVTLLDATGAATTTPANWFSLAALANFDYANRRPNVRVNIPAATNMPPIQANLQVEYLYTGPLTGAGVDRTGSGGGAMIYFLTLGEGADASSDIANSTINAGAETSAVYRYVHLTAPE